MDSARHAEADPMAILRTHRIELRNQRVNPSDPARHSEVDPMLPVEALSDPPRHAKLSPKEKRSAPCAILRIHRIDPESFSPTPLSSHRSRQSLDQRATQPP